MGILADPVVVEECIYEIRSGDFRRIYDMERGSTEVGFEHDLEPMKFGTFGILT